MWLRKQSGHDQHAAITAYYHNFYHNFEQLLDLGVCGFGHVCWGMLWPWPLQEAKKQKWVHFYDWVP